MNLEPRLIGAVIGSLIALGIGGGGLAFAQEDPTTTAPPAPEAPADPAPDDSREGCDKEDRASTTGDAPAGPTSL